jgi:hypothetical protein
MLEELDTVGDTMSLYYDVVREKDLLIPYGSSALATSSVTFHFQCIDFSTLSISIKPAPPKETVMTSLKALPIQNSYHHCPCLLLDP